MMNSRLFGAVVFAAGGIVVGMALPFSGLALKGHLVLAIVITALGLWIFRPGDLPYAAGGALIIAGCLALGLPYGDAAAGFVSPAVWVLIPALYFGFALQNSDLGKRIAYFVLKSFKPSFFTIIISWFIIGVVLSAFTPSITVRVAIVMPVALYVVEACKLNGGSRGASMITLTAWAMAVFPGTGWLTGSLYGPIMTGFLPAELKPLANFDTWFKIMALPWFLITVVFVILLFFALRPKEPLGITRETFLEQYRALGKISRPETITAITLLAALLAFTTERYHQVPTAAVALAAFFVLIVFRVIILPDISRGINWDIIMFFGATISLSTIFAQSGISNWLGRVLEPGVLALAGSTEAFLIILTLALWLIRFVDVPWGFSTAALTATLLIPLYGQFGIHPLVGIMIFTAAGNCFFLTYQQPFLIIGESIARGRGWRSGHVTLAGLLYAVAVMVSLMASLLYWESIGAIR